MNKIKPISKEDLIKLDSPINTPVTHITVDEVIEKGGPFKIDPKHFVDSCSNIAGHVGDRKTDQCIYCGTKLPAGFPYKDEVDVQEMDRLRIEEAQKQKANSFSGDHITQALSEAFDRLYEASSLQAILLGDIARACHEQKPFPPVEQIEFAVPISALTYEVKSNFKTWGFRETKFGYEYEYSVPLQWEIRVPVKIYVYKEKFKLFDVPDRVWAGVDGAFIPNPFASYWKIRHLVKKKLEKGLKLSSESL